MNNKKGFTLIELLATLLVLAIILSITIYSVSKILDNSEDSINEIQEKRIVEAAKNWYLKEGMNENKDKSSILVSELINKGYIDNDEVKDAKTNESLTGCVLISKSGEKYNYTYSNNCSTDLEQ